MESRFKSPGSLLCGWLNGNVADYVNSGRPQDEWTAESHGRVLACVDLVKRIHSLIKERDALLNDAYDAPYDHRPGMREQGYSKREMVKDLLLKLGEQFSHYPVQYYPEEESDELGGSRIVLQPQYPAEEFPGGEVMAIVQVQDLISSGIFEELQQCSVCSTWFMMARSDQQTCSARCRHKLYEKTPEAQAKRREYMRGYYRLKKSGKVRD